MFNGADVVCGIAGVKASVLIFGAGDLQTVATQGNVPVIWKEKEKQFLNLKAIVCILLLVILLELSLLRATSPWSGRKKKNNFRTKRQSYTYFNWYFNWSRHISGQRPHDLEGKRKTIFELKGNRLHTFVGNFTGVVTSPDNVPVIWKEKEKQFSNLETIVCIR